MKKKTALLIIPLLFLFLLKSARANIVFPAIAHQFMVSVVVPSYYSVIMAVLILTIEAVFIGKLFSINFARSFVFSFIINLLSSAAGAVITSIFLGRGSLSGLAGVFAYRDMKLGTYLGLFPGYVLTVIFEWFLLLLAPVAAKSMLRRGLIFKTCVIMNLSSYIILILGIFLADVLTGGEVFKAF